MMFDLIKFISVMCMFSYDMTSLVMSSIVILLYFYMNSGMFNVFLVVTMHSLYPIISTHTHPVYVWHNKKVYAMCVREWRTEKGGKREAN